MNTTFETPEHIEQAAERYRRLRKSKITTMEDWAENSRQANEAYEELTGFFEPYFGPVDYENFDRAGDDLTIEELEQQIFIASELKRLLRGRHHDVAHDLLPALRRNLRTRISIRERWGMDVPAGRLWNDRWDAEDIYVRKGTAARIIRAWVRSLGHNPPTGGRIPQQIVAAYVRAHSDRWSEALVINHPGTYSVEVWCYQCASVHLHGETEDERGEHVGGPKSPHCDPRCARQYWVSDYTAPHESHAETEQLRADAGLTNRLSA